MDVLREHEIAEAGHRILTRSMDEKLELLGELGRWRRDMRLLDLASGKGEMLCTWARRTGSAAWGWTSARSSCRPRGTGPLTWGSPTGSGSSWADASTFAVDEASFDAVACIGATWIGGGLAGTIALMRPALAPGGLLLIGEPFWREEPPGEAHAALDLGPHTFTSLAGTWTASRMPGSSSWRWCWPTSKLDRYMAAAVWTAAACLDEHPGHPDAAGMREYLSRSRRSYLAYGRRYLGWGGVRTAAAGEGPRAGGLPGPARRRPRCLPGPA